MEKDLTNLDSADALRGIISSTIDTICLKCNMRYPNICKYASRTPDDKQMIINRIFDMMAEGDLELDEAVAQVDVTLEEA